MWTTDIAIHPWVGGRYENPIHFKHKTLILGESNFTEVEKFKPNLVIDCVRNDVSTDPLEERDTTGFCRFSTKLRRIIFGNNETIGPHDFWQDVAFYNFVQALVGKEARARPTQEMWQKSVPAFFEIVSTLKPSKILVLGKANWDNLLRHVQHETIDKFAVNIQIGSEFVAAGYVNHPSSSLSYSKWQPIAQNFLLS